MRLLKMVCLVWISVLGVGAMATTAALAESTPLPDIHTALPGEAYPLLLGGHLAGVGKLESASGGLLESREFSVLLSAQELTSLGRAALVFLGLEEVKEKHTCHTPGASEVNGEVVVPSAEWHLVYTAVSPAEKLELGALILYEEFFVECNSGAFEVELAGSGLTRVNVPSPEAGKEGDSTDIEMVSHCPAEGVQELPYYYNDKLERVATTVLLRVAGGKKLPACEEIEGTVLLTPETGSTATMFSVLF